MKHLDLFSGIGGFALAADRVFGNVEHVFCEIDPFCVEVLKKHWPNSKIYGDIRTITTDTRGEKSGGLSGVKRKTVSTSRQNSVFILTGGFPCQPFSQAGRRKGTEDDRHLWPEMLRVIRLTKPQWVIAENVRGLLTIGGGVVFEQVCLDLESASYEVQPLVIPAVAVNAPHRRDRVWFVAHKLDKRLQRSKQDERTGYTRQCSGDGEDKTQDIDAQNTISKRDGRRMESRGQVLGSKSSKVQDSRPSWESNWLEVATRLCRVDDGLPRRLDRNPRLKALGNAIVPQVAEEIMRAISLIIPNNTLK